MNNCDPFARRVLSGLMLRVHVIRAAHGRCESARALFSVLQFLRLALDTPSEPLPSSAAPSQIQLHSHNFEYPHIFNAHNPAAVERFSPIHF